MANELGLDYENVPIHFADGSAKTPEYLAVNPNGRIPAIDDNGFKLWESMAINLYLAKKHGSGLLPKTMEDEAQAIQCSFWVMTEVDKPALAVLLHRFFLPEDQRDSKLADEGEQQLQTPLAVLQAVFRHTQQFQRGLRVVDDWAEKARSRGAMTARVPTACGRSRDCRRARSPHPPDRWGCCIGAADCAAVSLSSAGTAA
jgi:glutathione S-transferase